MKLRLWRDKIMFTLERREEIYDYILQNKKEEIENEQTNYCNYLRRPSRSRT